MSLPICFIEIRCTREFSPSFLVAAMPRAFYEDGSYRHVFRRNFPSRSLHHHDNKNNRLTCHTPMILILKGNASWKVLRG